MSVHLLPKGPVTIADPLQTLSMSCPSPSCHFTDLMLLSVSRSVSRRFQPFIPFQMADDPALYGKAYIPAAKDTWRLMKDRGIDALINDSLIGTGTVLIHFLPISYSYVQSSCGGLMSMVSYVRYSVTSICDVSCLEQRKAIRELEMTDQIVTDPAYNSEGQYTP